MKSETISQIPADGFWSVRLYANLFAYKRTFSRILNTSLLSRIMKGTEERMRPRGQTGQMRHIMDHAGFYLAFGRMRLK